jgi:GLPGLI family protein
MKKIITLTATCLVAIAAVAHEKADIEVSYTASQPSLMSGKVEKSNQYILIANASESKFYSPMTEYLDSLESTPEGQAKYKEMSRNAFMSGNQDKMPRRDGRYYVMKSANGNGMTTYDVNGLEKYVMVEPMPELDWQITETTKEILGYECQKAVATFHGREWTVWFTPAIPIMNGPWKLGGLPGLILEANEPSGLYSFTATGIQAASREILPVYSADAYEPIDRKEFLKLKRKMADNPISSMNAQLSGLGISIKSAGNAMQHKPREEADFIETDY